MILQILHGSTGRISYSAVDSVIVTANDKLIITDRHNVTEECQLLVGDEARLIDDECSVTIINATRLY